MATSSVTPWSNFLEELSTHNGDVRTTSIASVAVIPCTSIKSSLSLLPLSLSLICTVQMSLSESGARWSVFHQPSGTTQQIEPMSAQIPQLAIIVLPLLPCHIAEIHIPSRVLLTPLAPSGKVYYLNLLYASSGWTSEWLVTTHTVIHTHTYTYIYNYIHCVHVT